MSGLPMILRALGLLALLLLAWNSVRAKRARSKADLKLAMATSQPVLRATRAVCDEQASLLGDHGIRSWTLRADGAWTLVVDESNRAQALRVLEQSR